MARYWLRLALVAMLALPLSGCAFFRWLFGSEQQAAEEVAGMSDADIAALLAEWGGREIAGAGWQLGGHFISHTTLAGSITIFQPHEPQCAKYGWTQVIRESLDGEVVLDPTKLPDPDNLPGIREWSKPRTTPGGWVVDGHPNSTDIDYGDSFDETFSDEPNLPDAAMRQNTQKPNARIYRLEAETCRRCVRPPPPGAFGPCFRWYYVRIRGGDGQPNRSFMISQQAPEATPSGDFNAAVKAWQQP